MMGLIRKSICILACFASCNIICHEVSLKAGIPEYLTFCKNERNKAVDIPNILFEFNSTNIYREKEEDQKMYEQKVNISIEHAKKIFDEEPTTVIEICGHCDWLESNKKKLSFARAKYIADELIKKGISRKRIVIKGEGDEELLNSKKIIEAAPTEQDKENKHLQNRRITVKVLRWDFKN